MSFSILPSVCHTHATLPFESKTGWSEELWSKTNLLMKQNKDVLKQTNCKLKCNFSYQKILVFDQSSPFHPISQIKGGSLTLLYSCTYQCYSTA